MKTFKKQFLLLLFLPLALISCEKELQMDEPGNLVLKTVDEDPELPFINVNGTKLHAETFGNPDNSIVIFLHGGPGADYRNGLQVKELADDGYFVVFYDQRGSGLSRRHNRNTFSTQIMIDDVSAVINYYKNFPTQKVFLIGHSWGGMLAAGYIDQNPNTINGVVFAEPGGFNKDLLDEYNENGRKLHLFDETTSDLVYMDQFLTGGENDHEILDYKYGVQAASANAAGGNQGVEGPSPFWRYGAAVLNKLVEIVDEDGLDFTQNLNQFTPKVLSIYSENNEAYGREFAIKEASYFTNYEVVQIGNTGHEMFYFKWDGVHPVVLEYLNSLN